MIFKICLAMERKSLRLLVVKREAMNLFLVCKLHTLSSPHQAKSKQAKVTFANSKEQLPRFSKRQGCQI